MELACPNPGCDGTVLAGDLFCASCGAQVPEAQRPAPWTAVPPATTAPAALPSLRITPPPAGDSEPLFSHEQRRAPGPVNSATRFLCAAAYLNHDFANRVIQHLLVTRRAVAPSVNFDVGPVLRHCLRARRNILIRDAVLLVIVVAGLAIKLSATIDFLFFVLALGLILPRATRHPGGPGRLIAGVIGGLIALAVAVGLAFVLTSGFTPSSVALSPSGAPVASSSALPEFLVTFALLVAATWLVELTYLYTTFQTLDADLGEGTTAQTAYTGSPETEERIAMVEGAQHGNITLHSGWFPFIGAGLQSDAAWSIAIRLDRADPDDDGENDDGEDDRDHPGGNGRSGRGSARYVRIDPVDLHQWIGNRLRALNDPGLPENERISALTVTDRLVGSASGLLRTDNPLFDQNLRTPYSHASREAIEAMIRHPQARLRYYQQVSLSDEGPAVMSRGRKVVESVDQEIAVSAFIYAAVEGHMFYLQFVLTVLPPIHALYRVAGRTRGASPVDMVIDSARHVFGSIISAPFGLYAALLLWISELPRVSRTGIQRLLHAATWPFRYSSRTSCGVLYPSPEWRRVLLYRS
ncbi:MAG TPA: hypothetical protein VGG75_42850, partial [Trebonia sp.]